jgi:hypothetical protein
MTGTTYAARSWTGQLITSETLAHLGVATMKAGTPSRMWDVTQFSPGAFYPIGYMVGGVLVNDYLDPYVCDSCAKWGVHCGSCACCPKGGAR